VGKTPEEIKALEEYARRVNAWLDANGPKTVCSTKGSLRAQASAAAKAERARAAAQGTPYTGQAGHVPDTALTKQPNPPLGWLDMPGTSNNAAGGALGPHVGEDVKEILINGKRP